MALSDEQMRRLPYQETPATSLDVTKEITHLMTMVASLVHVAMAPYSHRTADLGAKRVTEMIQDATKEPGRSVLIQQTRVAFALESWAGEYGQEIIKSFGEALPNIVAESIAAIHDEAHQPQPCETCGKPRVHGFLPEAITQLVAWGYCVGHDPEPHLFVVDPKGEVDGG